MEKYIGATIIDMSNYEWKILGYQGDTLRIYSVSGNFLSEAEGKNIHELIEDFQAIEEVYVSEIKLLIE